MQLKTEFTVSFHFSNYYEKRAMLRNGKMGPFINDSKSQLFLNSSSREMKHFINGDCDLRYSRYLYSSPVPLRFT